MPTNDRSTAVEAGSPRKRGRRRIYVLSIVLAALIVVYLPLRLNRLNDALVHAVYDRDALAVHRLLDAGADPNVHLPSLTGPPASAALLDWLAALFGFHRPPVRSNARSMLMVAAAMGSEPIALDLMTHGASVNARLPNGTTPLVIACSSRSDRMAAELVHRGARFDMRDGDGLSPFLLARNNGMTRTADELLKHGCNVHDRDSSGRRALYIAAEARRTGITRLLMSRGATIRDLSITGSPPLLSAARFGSVDLMQTAYRADPAAAALSSAALILAIRTGKLEAVRYLLDHGARAAEPVPFSGSLAGRIARPGIPRSLAIQSIGGPVRSAAVASLSPSSGGLGPGIAAEPVFPGSLPLVETARRGDQSVMSLLLQRGASVDSREPSGETALVAALRARNLEAARLLIDKGANVNLAGAGGESPALAAASGSMPEPGKSGETAVKLVAAHGADPRARTQFWETVLMRAVNKPESLRLCPSRGVDVNAQNRNGETALLRAPNVDSARLLVEHGADPNRADLQGRTPLMNAAQTLNDRLVVLLLQHGADANAVDRQGRSALSLLAPYMNNVQPPNSPSARVIALLEDASQRRRKAHRAAYGPASVVGSVR